MKLKFISLFLLAISLQSFAMEQDNSVLPNEILIQIICKAINSSTYKEALQMLQSLEKTSKQLRTLAYDDEVKKEFTQLKNHYKQLTRELIAELDKEKPDFNRIKQVILEGADFNVSSTFGFTTALIGAARDGQIEVVKQLLINGADVNTPSIWGGYTALIEAAQNGHTNIVQLLIDNNANVNAKTIQNLTALMLATCRHRTDTVKLLLENHADVNVQNKDDGRTALMYATKYGYTDIVDLLLQHGAQLATKTNLENKKNSCIIS